MMMPERFAAYRSAIPLLDEATEWSLLRKWSLSEVYRVALANGETRILKWGGEEMSGEAAFYNRLVNPLNIKAPSIYGYYEGENSAVIVMEDAGERNLEQQPLSHYFLEAARELANIRTTASANLKWIPDDIIHLYTVSAAQFLAFLDDLLRLELFSGNSALMRLQSMLPHEMNKLYETVPLTLVHHDYHAKNLLIQGNGIMPVDWANAYLSPHLGDLYCLIKEARIGSNVAKEDVISAFLDGEGADMSLEQLDWQVRLGGICWFIKTIRWLVYRGTETIPGSDAWIPDMLKELESLVEGLRRK